MDEMKAGNLDLADVERKIKAKGLDAGTESRKGVFREIAFSLDETYVILASSHISNCVDIRYFDNFETCK